MGFTIVNTVVVFCLVGLVCLILPSLAYLFLHSLVILSWCVWTFCFPFKPSFTRLSSAGQWLKWGLAILQTRLQTCFGCCPWDPKHVIGLSLCVLAFPRQNQNRSFQWYLLVPNYDFREGFKYPRHRGEGWMRPASVKAHLRLQGVYRHPEFPQYQGLEHAMQVIY